MLPVHLFFPSFTPPLEIRGCQAKLGRKYGWLATRDINVQKLESQFTPHTLPEFSRGYSPLSSSLSLSFLRRYSTRRKLLLGYRELFGLIKVARLGGRRSSMKKLVPRDVSERRVLDERCYENLVGWRD